MRSGVAEPKTELRLRMRALRKALSPEERAIRSHQIAANIKAAAQSRWPHAKHWGVFYPLKSEPDLMPLWKELVRTGNILAFPRMSEDPQLGFEFVEVNAAELSALDDSALWFQSRFGVKEPISTKRIEKLDVILVPGLAFSEKGERLGMGKGHYDRVLQRYSDATHIGVCFDFQLLKTLPQDPWDVTLSGVITDQRKAIRPLTVK